MHCTITFSVKSRPGTGKGSLNSNQPGATCIQSPEITFTTQVSVYGILQSPNIFYFINNVGNYFLLSRIGEHALKENICNGHSTCQDSGQFDSCCYDNYHMNWVWQHNSSISLPLKERNVGVYAIKTKVINVNCKPARSLSKKLKAKTDYINLKQNKIFIIISSSSSNSMRY